MILFCTKTLKIAFKISEAQYFKNVVIEIKKMLYLLKIYFIVINYRYFLIYEYVPV